MTKIQDGRFQNEAQEAILSRMVSNAENYFGETLSDDQLSPIISLYRPVANEIANLQEDIGLVLDSAQIDHAEGEALDLLCALINVVRNEAERATGTVEFTRSTNATKDYPIPKGTVIQTDSNEPIQFRTTEQVVLSSGTSSVTAKVEAVEAGIVGNVPSNRIVVFENRPAGVESVNNNSKTDGGTPREKDDELRERAKKEVANGSGASIPALLTSVNGVSEEVRSVRIKANTSNSADGQGLPGHSFEIIVECPSTVYKEVAKEILWTKAAGDQSYSGAYVQDDGSDTVSETIELPNGQTEDVEFSTPTEVKLYLDIDIETSEAYAGDEALINNIVDYVGGNNTNGEPVDGELRPGDNVVEGEIEYAIRDTKGVHDVTTLDLNRGSSPADGDNDNITIDFHEVAVFEGDNLGTYLDGGDINSTETKTVSTHV